MSNTNIEVISALAIAITGLITAIGMCVTRLHMKRLRMKNFCGEVSIDMGSQNPTKLEEENKRPSFETISSNTMEMLKAMCGADVKIPSTKIVSKDVV